jgi:bifunctional DNase/RNase
MSDFLFLGERDLPSCNMISERSCNCRNEQPHRGQKPRTIETSDQACNGNVSPIHFRTKMIGKSPIPDSGISPPVGAFQNVVARTATLCCNPHMGTDSVEVFLKMPVQHSNGYALFIGNDEKTIIIYVDAFAGDAIRMIQEGVRKERPLTHDLISFVFQGFGIQLKKVLINDVSENLFFARMTLEMENEIGRKIVELDARPSDCITLALMHQIPILMSRTVLDRQEDMTEIMERILNQQE